MEGFRIGNHKLLKLFDAQLSQENQFFSLTLGVVTMKYYKNLSYVIDVIKEKQNETKTIHL